MLSKNDKIKLGTFLIVAFALALLVLGAFAGLQLWERNSLYKTYYEESVAGLNVGSQVRLSGVQVGTVRKMRVDPKNVERVEITMALEPGTPVVETTRAHLVAQGLTGLKFIDLQEGKKDAKPMPPGWTIPAGKGLITRLTERAETITDNADDAIKNATTLLNAENRAKIERILTKSEALITNVDALTVELTKTLSVTRQLLEKNERSISITLQNAAVASGELQGVLKDTRRVIALGEQKIEKAQLELLIQGLIATNEVIQTSLSELDMKNISQSLTVLQGLVKQLTQGLGQNQEHLRSMLFNMRRTTDNLRDLSQELRDKPSRLVFEDKPEPRKLP